MGLIDILIKLKDVHRELADNYLANAKSAQAEGRQRAMKNRFQAAIRYLALAGHYDSAYELALQQQFPEMAEWVYKEQIMELEKKGKFLACALLEEIRGNPQRAKTYEALSALLKIA